MTVALSCLRPKTALISEWPVNALMPNRKAAGQATNYTSQQISETNANRRAQHCLPMRLPRCIVIRHCAFATAHYCLAVNLLPQRALKTSQCGAIGQRPRLTNQSVVITLDDFHIDGTVRGKQGSHGTVNCGSFSSDEPADGNPIKGDRPGHSSQLIPPLPVGSRFRRLRILDATWTKLANPDCIDHALLLCVA